MPPLPPAPLTPRRLADVCVALVVPGGMRVAPYLFFVEGYLYPHEGAFLYRLAREAPGDGPVVEIGSFQGRSTLCLAAGVRRRAHGRVVAIDPQLYGSGPVLRANLRRFGLEAWVEVREQASIAEAARFDERPRLVFIDGDHSGEAVGADVAAWGPRLAPGGFLLLHDATSLSGFPGPRALATALLGAVGPGGRFTAAGTLGGIAWFRTAGGIVWEPRQPGRLWLDPLLRMVLPNATPAG